MNAKTTGQQLGLLGARFDGPVTGNRTRELFDVRWPEEPAPAETLDERIARRFANTPTIPLFPLQESKL